VLVGLLAFIYKATFTSLPIALWILLLFSSLPSFIFFLISFAAINQTHKI